ncbi:MAG: hypothetical protein NWF14_04755 [Candidatus Bathyarchaeota archaeon]|nr:hypothetical protein [Candidatus Bathyarchaeota archaeon]
MVSVLHVRQHDRYIWESIGEVPEVPRQRLGWVPAVEHYWNLELPR